MNFLSKLRRILTRKLPGVREWPPAIAVGKYTLGPTDTGHIAIYRDDGEGGAFFEKDLEDALDVFYRERF